MLFLTADQHRVILQRLLDLGRSQIEKVSYRRADLAYTSLMFSFLLQSFSAAETLLRLSNSFGKEWYPVTVGYTIARTMFEVDVTAHYITKAPVERCSQYIDFAAVLNKRAMDACGEHRNSKDPQWREAMSLLWENHWAAREVEVMAKFNAVAPRFTRVNRNGKTTVFQNWTGKTLRQMAEEVEHLEAYDVFYSELSSFTHADVHLADRYLQVHPDGPIWSQRANEGDVGNVFRHAASFLTCYLELFGEQFKTWKEAEILSCWRFDSIEKSELMATIVLPCGRLALCSLDLSCRCRQGLNLYQHQPGAEPVQETRGCDNRPAIVGKYNAGHAGCERSMGESISDSPKIIAIQQLLDSG